MTSHPNRRSKSLVTGAQIVGDQVEFRANNTDYIYRPARGRLYVGETGAVIHQAPAGSFDFNQATGSDIAFYAKLLGANIYVRGNKK